MARFVVSRGNVVGWNHLISLWGDQWAESEISSVSGPSSVDYGEPENGLQRVLLLLPKPIGPERRPTMAKYDHVITFNEMWDLVDTLVNWDRPALFARYENAFDANLISAELL